MLMNQRKIYIGNLSYNATEDSVRDAFNPFGGIDDLILIKDRDTGRLKGFGFITFDSAEAAEKAVSEMDGCQLDGRAIKVSIAQEKKAGGGGDRRGGRGDEGGRGRW